MKCNKIFDVVLAIVSEECEIETALILKSFNRDAVDARCLLVCQLSDLGLSDEIIASYLYMTRQGVNRLRNTYHARCRFSYWLKSASQVISNRVAREMGI